ncbi:hypothetical protein J2Y69_002129 [Microbacterium resistens]|uniref:Uncharacterized protein n=1 Tax=Microbacterium resistens TaxID=156977 RepID=A0ABU1SD56_9MICO|nr:hypothetical protein [Microbacterium resistens]MDR6867525.1 hypothetical protein [Microbacterium resistens]
MTEQSEELVYLTAGPEYDDGELVTRAEAPNDAFRLSLEVKGEDIEGGEPGRIYECWGIER